METLAARTPPTAFRPSQADNMGGAAARVMEGGAGYRLEPITGRDSEAVIRFLRRFFFKDEPLNIAVGLLDEPGSTCVELEKYCLDSIPDGVSVMAVSPSNHILGVCINGITTRQDADTQDLKNEEIEECANKKFKKILNLLSTVARESDLFGQYAVERVLEIRVISVDDACRGQGIAKALVDRTKVLAKELSFPMIRMDCTSHFSAKIAVRLGFECVYTLQYADHLNEDGEPVFRPELPHTCVKTYIIQV